MPPNGSACLVRAERPGPCWNAGDHRPPDLRSVLSVGPLPATIRAATRTASIRLDGSARPFQAMSKAVPCATLVRTIGRPKVTLTARSKPTVLSAMWPWSWYIATTASYAPARAW